MLSNKKINSVVPEFFIKTRKLNICPLLHNLILLYQEILE